MSPDQAVPMKPCHFRQTRRITSLPDSVITEMSRIGDEYGAVNLSQGLPDFDPPMEVLDAAVSAIRTGGNQYTNPIGSPAFRAAIAERYSRKSGMQFDPDQEITVTCGVSEGLAAVVLALTDPGDEVIVIEPWFESYVPDCLLAGATPRLLELKPPDYTLDLEDLQAAFNPRSRLILINTPHNPSGRVFTREELGRIADLCQQHDVIALVDETYENILYDGRKHIHMASLPGMQARTITFGGLGKSYAVTGWRIGWIAAAKALSEAIRKVHVYLTVCAPAPFQAGGVAALNLPDSYYEDMRRQYAARRDLLTTALRKAGFFFPDPQGSYFLMADFSQVRWNTANYDRQEWTTDRSFAEFLVREVGIAVVPGSSFYVGGQKGIHSVRFNFAKKETTLQEAVLRLERLKTNH